VILAAAIPVAAVLPPLATLGLVAITLAALTIYAGTRIEQHRLHDSRH